MFTLHVSMNFAPISMIEELNFWHSIDIHEIVVMPLDLYDMCVF